MKNFALCSSVVQLYEILHLISIYRKAGVNSCSDTVLKCCSNVSDTQILSSMFMLCKLQFGLSLVNHKMPGQRNLYGICCK